MMNTTMTNGTNQNGTQNCFDYFYGNEETSYTFYQLPRFFWDKSTDLYHLSIEAKVLYAFFQDRLSLSIKNRWMDDNGKAFLIFTHENIMDVLNCANQKATKVVRELVDAGLVEKVKQGLNRPDLIYVKNYDTHLKYPKKQYNGLPTSNTYSNNDYNGQYKPIKFKTDMNNISKTAKKSECSSNNADRAHECRDDEINEPSTAQVMGLDPCKPSANNTDIQNNRNYTETTTTKTTSDTEHTNDRSEPSGPSAVVVQSACGESPSKDAGPADNMQPDDRVTAYTSSDTAVTAHPSSDVESTPKVTVDPSPSIVENQPEVKTEGFSIPIKGGYTAVEFLDLIRKEFQEKLNTWVPNEQLYIIFKTCKGDIDLLSEKIDLMRTQANPIRNVFGWIITALKKDYKPAGYVSNYESKNKKPLNRIVNYKGHNYDYAKLAELEQEYMENAIKDS